MRPEQLGEERERLARFWDHIIDRWLGGETDNPDLLQAWFTGYQGAGSGAVQPEAIPEPWIGPLLGSPRLLVLGLNPGGADLRFQGRDGLFAAGIRQSGFTEWAASSPYSRPPWTEVHGPNRYQGRRLDFARRFYGTDTIGAGDVLAMELYPWHSHRVSGPIRVPETVLEEMLWRPLSEIDLADVFAFGRPWVGVADSAGLKIVDRLGVGGRAWGSTVPSRQVVIYRLPSGQRLIVSSQPGYAGPPGPPDTRRLRELLIKL